MTAGMEAGAVVRVGYIGLGAIGGTFARRLVAAHDLVVWDLDPAAIARMETLGASAAVSSADLARRCEVVLICLPRSSDVRTVLFGPAGVAERLSAGQIVVDQTSGVPGETRQMARRLEVFDVSMIDAPVSGNPMAITAGSHVVMAPMEVLTVTNKGIREGERHSCGQHAR